MKKWLLILLALALTLSALPAKNKTMSIENFEKEVWRLTNIERTRHSLKPLAYEPGLVELARYHSLNMQKNNFFAHRDPQGDEVSGRQKKLYPTLVISCIGENIGRFRNSTGAFAPQDLVNGWMNSPEHRSNILNPDYTHLGVGIALNRGVMYATQNFTTSLAKIKTDMPQGLQDGKMYRISFQYLSPNQQNRLAGTLIYPDPTKLYQISEEHVMVGVQPLQIEWVSKSEFDVIIPFSAGKGDYKICFGFDGGYFPDGLVLKAN